MNLIEIRDLAETFRKAIEDYIDMNIPKNKLLRSFPEGNCTLASDHLQRFLFEKGINTYRVNGSAGYGWGSESHEWLMTEDGIIIDITGDQYCTRTNEFQYDKPVYVGTMDSFHKLFSIKKGSPYLELHNNINSASESIEMKDAEDYEGIIKLIE